MNVIAVRAGFSTTVQDLGRTGFRQSGVSLGGALDAHGLRVANLLVGNEESAAGLEVVFGGLQLRFSDERIVAWCGGGFDVRVGSIPLPAGHPILFRKDEELVIDRPKTGCRAWITISGGIDVPVSLGSRSTDLRAGFGGLNGCVLRDSHEIPLGRTSRRAKILIDKLGNERIAAWSPAYDWSNTARREPVLRFVRGAHWTLFSNVMLQRFTSATFAVSADSDRMGVRFEAPQLTRNDDADLISEAVAPGTIQVPPGGKPILLLGDCQTIGGYPKIAHVVTVDFAIAAQLRGGDGVRFREVSLADACQLLLDRERNFEQFRRGLQAHFS